MEILSYLLIPFQQPMLLLLVAIGTFAGVYVAAIPGLTGTMAVSLLVSFTYGWDTYSAIAIMIGVFMGAAYGGSWSAILLNIPGAPSAVATALDGYPLAKKGLAGKAIGLSTMESCIGGLLGALALGLFAPLISTFATKFVARDYLLLAILGMMMVGSLGSKSLTKSMLTACLGLMIGVVGMDSMTGAQRFTFGNAYLMGGVNSTVAMIGLFGGSEALMQIMDRGLPVVKQKVDKVMPSLSDIRKHFPLTLQSSVIGALIGALPGAGGSIASLLSYDRAKHSVKDPEVPFGEGAVEGVIAPEAANNAAVGGALIPMLTLGIPGDAVTAVMLGALTIHGLTPGPTLISKTPELFYLIVACLILACLFVILAGMTGVRVMSKLVEIPKGRMVPIIMILSVAGSYALNKNLYDVFWMIGFSVLGYFFKKYDYPIAPMVLGVILSGMMEKNFRSVIILGNASKEGLVLNLLKGLFTSPISLVLLILVIFTAVIQTKWYQNWREKRKSARKE